MTTQATVVDPAAEIGGIPFTIASRPQARLGNIQTVNNVSAGGSFAIIPLAATGWVRKVSLFFTQVVTFASAGAVVAGDGPWNLITGITLTDATGQPIQQPISGFNQYLINKWFPSGGVDTMIPRPYSNPMLSPEYAFASTGTQATVAFRLDIDLEIDSETGYGCIPNLDSNASLQLKIDYAPYTVALTGTTPSASNLSVRVSQDYWAPVSSGVGTTAPPGRGDYCETRYETQVVSAASENLVNLTNRGGLVKGVILVSRAAGVRTAVTAGAMLGTSLDNMPMQEGVTIEEHVDRQRRMNGYFGADITTSYAPLTPGVMVGGDRGVVPINFDGLSSGKRNTWLDTRGGSLFQVKFTPGTAATQLEIITQLAQAKDPVAFYGK